MPLADHVICLENVSVPGLQEQRSLFVSRRAHLVEDSVVEGRFTVGAAPVRVTFLNLVVELHFYECI